MVFDLNKTVPWKLNLEEYKSILYFNCLVKSILRSKVISRHADPKNAVMCICGKFWSLLKLRSIWSLFEVTRFSKTKNGKEKNRQKE